MTPRLLPMLSENWARTSDRDLRTPVPIAAETDKVGIDGIAGPFPAPDAVADLHETLREPPSNWLRASARSASSRPGTPAMRGRPGPSSGG